MMSKIAFTLLISPMFFLGVASAQSGSEPAKTPSEQARAEAEKLADHSKKINPQDPITVAKASAGALPSDPRLDLVRKRALQAIAHNAKYLAEVKDCKAAIWGDAAKKLPQIQDECTRIKQLISQLNNQNLTVPNREKIEAQIRTQLQPIGQYLQTPAYLKEDRSLTPEQVKVITDWRKEVEAFEANISLQQKGKFKIVGLRNAYTLLFLPHPIRIETEPGATVYLKSPTGGRFSNELSHIKLKADKNGIIQDYWISKGYSTGPSPIRVVCPEVGVIDGYHIDVVHPVPHELLTKTATTLKKQIVK